MWGRKCSFDVANYPMHRITWAHTLGRNVYLYPREVLEANVFINLPKVKTHMKAGITCALKNLIGTIGMKDYLPHFRFGSPKKGGDEYPNGNWLWDLKWWFAHKKWERDGGPVKFVLWAAERICGFGLRALYRYPRDYHSIAAGGWFGNDTLWCTILDVLTGLSFITTGRPEL